MRTITDEHFFIVYMEYEKDRSSYGYSIKLVHSGTLIRLLGLAFPEADKFDYNREEYRKAIRLSPSNKPAAHCQLPMRMLEFSSSQFMHLP